MASQHTSSPPCVSSSFDQTEVYSIEKDNFKDWLPKLREALEDEKRNVRLRAVQAMLGQCLPFCSPSLIDETLLEDAVPVAREIFMELIDEINDMVLTGGTTIAALDDVKLRLDMCVFLLDCWRQCLEHIEVLQSRMSASQVKSLPENLSGVIKRSFEHCKASKDIYGVLFDDATDYLTAFFRKVNEVQKLLHAVLERVIVFNPGVSLEMTLLANVVRTIGETGMVVNEMDMRTSVEVWKAFAKLAGTQCDYLKNFLPSCVTSNLKSLAIIVASLLRSAVEDADEKTAERTVKCATFLLKILVKLCTSYSGVLCAEAAFTTVQLLTQLHRYSPPCLKILGVDASRIDLIKIHLMIGTEPFLCSVINDPEFKLAYFGYREQGIKEAVGYHLLTINLMRKLITMPYNDRRSWLKAPHEILDVAFTNMNFCREELGTGQLLIAGCHALGEQPRLTTLYEATLVQICGLLINIPNSNFLEIELLLQKHLLGGQFWSSLLASDVWVFIARCGSSELCYNHSVYLMEVYELVMAERNNSFEIVMLSDLIARLFTLLPNELKLSLVKKFGPNKALVLMPITRHLSPSTQSLLSEQASNSISLISRSIANLDENPTAKNWSFLIKQLWTVGTIGQSLNEHADKVLDKIWDRVAMAIGQFEGLQADLLTELTMALLHCTRISKVCDESFSSILSSITTILPYAAPCVRIEVSHYLKESVHSFAESGPDLMAVLAKLYCCLFEDRTPWVRQEAYESFDHVAHVSRNEGLLQGIANMVTEKPLICDSLPAYLSHTSYGQLVGFPSTEVYLQRLFRESQSAFTVEHTCHRQAEGESQDKRPKLYDQSKNSPSPMLKNIELDERVNIICDEINYLSKQKDELSFHSLNKLKSAADKMNMLIS